MWIQQKQLLEQISKFGTGSHHTRSVCKNQLFFFFFPVFWPCQHGMRDHSSLPGMKPMPPAMEVWCLNHWTTREAPYDPFWVNFCEKCKVRVWIHFFPMWMPCCFNTICWKTVLSPENFHRSLVRDQLTIFMWNYFFFWLALFFCLLWF